MTEDPMIAALLRERAGYVQRGLDDRVAAVDEQLQLRGHKPEPARGTAASDTKPRARRAPRAEKT